MTVDTNVGTRLHQHKGSKIPRQNPMYKKIVAVLHTPAVLLITLIGAAFIRRKDIIIEYINQ